MNSRDREFSAALLEAVPPPPAEPYLGWDEVLSRAAAGAGAVDGGAAVAADVHRKGRTSFRRLAVAVPVVVAVAALLAVATPAFGLREQIVDLFTLGAENRTVGVWSLPGETGLVPEIAAVAAREAGVDPTTLRAVASAGDGADRKVLVAGRGPDGTVWVAPASYGVAGDFDPLAQSVARGGAIITFLSGGGAKPTRVDHVELVGFVRSDVARVVVVFGDGSEEGVALNRWRGFGFAATQATALPEAVRAYDEEGDLIEERPVSVGPLCGGAAGPCPDLTP